MAAVSPEPYSPPAWARGLPGAPRSRLRLAGGLATPVEGPFELPGCPGVPVWVKRDDLSGGPELSGNKVRKLEFLLAEAADGGHRAVVTAGAAQSNHCRATATAARLAGLEPHLVLRGQLRAGGRAALDGNLLLDRLAGARLWAVTPEEYARLGQDELLRRAAARAGGAYRVPVGGSNWTGAWGYLECVRELEPQLRALPGPPVAHLAVACGSGGTAAGLALGAQLAGLDADVHAFGVCDSPEEFRRELRERVLAPGVPIPPRLELDDAQGAGYGIAGAEEYGLVRDLARAWGMAFDPTYTAKALLGLGRKIRANPARFRGRAVLFVHTGGQTSLHAAAHRAGLESALAADPPVSALLESRL